MKKATKKEMENEGVCKHCIVKRKGHSEEFDERKVYSSCYSACLSAGMSHIEAEKLCAKASKEVREWAHKKVMITSDEIFKKTVSAMKKHNHKAAYLYETHRDVS
jgi:transcriptional regulator NrdR family protein